MKLMEGFGFALGGTALVATAVVAAPFVALYALVVWGLSEKRDLTDHDVLGE
jgi:uncharacterized membrane protein